MSSRRKGTGRTPEEKAERRSQLVDAAVAAIRRDGPDVSMEAIAAEAGITKPIIYRHFGDRAGLVDAVAERFAGALEGQIAAALAAPDDPREVLRNAIDAFVALIDADPDVYRFLVHGALGSGTRTVQDFVQRIATQVTVVLGERLREAGLDSGPAEPWAHGIVGMVLLSGSWWAERRTITRERLVDDLVSLLWDGMSGVGLRALGAPPADTVPLHPRRAPKRA